MPSFVFPADMLTVGADRLLDLSTGGSSVQQSGINAADLFTVFFKSGGLRDCPSVKGETK